MGTTRYLHPMIIVLPYNWCADESGIVPTIVEGQRPDTLEFRGTVSFTNPYGSIPARLSTLLPFPLPTSPCVVLSPVFLFHLLCAICGRYLHVHRHGWLG